MSHDPPDQLAEAKLEVTQYCPLDCIHCSSEARPTAELEMPLPEARQVVKGLLKLGVNELVLSGGEPLAYAGLEELVSIGAAGASLSIYTTGHARDGKAVAASEWQRMATLGAARAIFSLQGAEPETHDRVTRVAGSFGVTSASIKAAVEAGLEAELHFVPMTRNFRELPRLVDLALSLGVRQLSLLRFVPHGRGRPFAGRVALGPAQRRELCTLLDQNEDRGVSLRLGSPYSILGRSSDVRCKAAVQCMTIGPDGKAYPCDAFKGIEPADIGLEDDYHNVTDTSVRAVWERSQYFAAVRAHLQEGFGETCSNCEYVSQCKSGCLAQKVIRYGKLTHRPDPECFGRWRGHLC